MAGSITISSITLDSDNNFSIKSNTGATLFFANTTGIDVANSLPSSSITNDKIVSVANTKITGNIVSSQITSVANTQITGNIVSSQITSVANTQITGNIAATTATTATTATNLDGGGANTIVYQSAAGTTAYLTNGTTGQFLAATTSGAPTWGTPSPSAMTLISKQTVSSQNPINWTGLSTYTSYLLIYTLAISAADAYYVQVGRGATPTWTTSGYNFGGNGYNQNNGVVSGSDYGASGFDLMGNMESGQYVGSPYLTGQCFITNALVSSSVGFTAQSFVNNTGRALNVAAAGSVVGVTAPITAIRLYTNGGNVYTGIISLYGIV
jgi:hypothetical protein